MIICEVLLFFFLFVINYGQSGSYNKKLSCLCPKKEVLRKRMNTKESIGEIFMAFYSLFDIAFKTHLACFYFIVLI